jgi:UDP-N-acetylmuramyl pentapeptide phosphotransferase/UDP-N-acetylglucosamine-1-phosphate transferase
MENSAKMLEAPVFAFIGAIIANLGISPWVIRQLLKKSLMDIPNARSSHESPVPRGVGILIILTWLLGMVLTEAMGIYNPVGFFIQAPDGFVIGGTLGMIVLAVLGLMDDRRDLSPFLKLVVQVAVAGGALWLARLPLERFGLPYLPQDGFGPWGWVLAMVWLVGFTNIFNFMDGINGLAFTQLIFGGAALSVMGVMVNDFELAVSGALAAGAAVGLLKYNFPQARVFMGDVGSLPAGFLLGLMALRAAFGADSSGQIPFLAPVLVLWPFLFDGGFTLLNRIVHRRNPFEAHRSHLYQRLLVAGQTHGEVTVIYGVAMLICALFGLMVPGWSDGYQITALASLLLASILFMLRTVRKVRASQTVENIHPS